LRRSRDDRGIPKERLGRTDGRTKMPQASRVLCNLWQARSDARETHRPEDQRSVAKQSQAVVDEWNDLQTKGHTVRTWEKEHWLPYDSGWCKVNRDGALHQWRGWCDHRGGFVAGACHFLPTLLMPKGRSS
jgi:hypothetical protein